MDVAEMKEPKQLARLKYAEYLRAVKTRRSAEYVTLKNAYREISLDRRVIDLAATMRNAGLDPLGRPRLAVIRADAKRCWFDRTFCGDARPTFNTTSDFWRGRRKGSAHVSFPADVFGPHRDVTAKRLSAIVPTIPPSLLPASGLERYLILWEAEWETVPVDPMLLRHLGHQLYVVVAAWDLTPLERAVLGATMQTT